MLKKLFVSFSILSSMLFSCAHVIYYDVTFIGEGYTHTGESKANNLNDYTVKFTANFGYVMDDYIEVYCGDSMLTQHTHYVFNNNELRIENNAITNNLKICINADIMEFDFESNIDSVKKYSKALCSFEGGSIDINHDPIIFTLEADTNYKIPQKDKFIFTAETRFDKNQLIFNYESETKLTLTIPSKLLGCDINVNIPDAEAK